MDLGQKSRDGDIVCFNTWYITMPKQCQNQSECLNTSGNCLRLTKDSGLRKEKRENSFVFLVTEDLYLPDNLGPKIVCRIPTLSGELQSHSIPYLIISNKNVMIDESQEV